MIAILFQLHHKPFHYLLLLHSLLRPITIIVIVIVVVVLVGASITQSYLAVIV